MAVVGNGVTSCEIASR